MSRHPIFIELDKRAPGQKWEADKHPPPEEEFGGGDLCSPELDPPTEEDKPLN
jgi:hypothetical protein